MVQKEKTTIGRYEILGEIGKGAMGTVHRARDPLLDRVVALKTMSGAAMAETEARERFLREARSVARLQHPNIITIFELGQVDDVPFIAMEYLDGADLSASHGRLPEVESRLVVVEQLCRGLAYAHGRGVIHRDVKPSNVFLLPDGMVKILDFGIAWLEGGTFATRTGMILGTPSYMAPEQFTGKTVDHRVDIWATGAILYELLAGERPFDAGTVPSLIYQIVHSTLPPLDSVKLNLPAGLDGVVYQALAKDPAERFQDLDSMRRALQSVMTGEGWSGGGDGGASAGSRAHFADTVQLQKGEVDTIASPPTVLPAVAEGREQGSDLGLSSFREAGLIGDASGLQVIAVSPDETQLVIGGVDGSVRLWSFSTRTKVHTLRSRVHLRTGHSALTTALAYSADGEVLASGHLDGSIYLWNPHSGMEMEAQLRHDGAVTGLGFTPDGNMLVSGGMDATIKYWDMAALRVGEARRLLRRQPDDVTAFTISRRGDVVVSGHVNRNLRIHDIESGRLVATLHGHQAPPSALALSPDNSLLASGSRDGTIRLYRSESRAQLRVYEGHANTVSSLKFFPDGRHLVSTAMGPGAAVWSVNQEDRVATLSGGQDETCADVLVIGEGRRVLCGLADGHVRMWDLDA
ncbi:MAG: WD40 repeat domain-containing serine/threonine protein kinase [Thermoanaerobaculales bacterium]